MKSSKSCLAVLVAAVACAGTANAGQVQMSHPGDAYRVPSFSGGSFRATTVSGYNGVNGGFGGTANSFLTFCLERDEHVSLTATYYTTISTGAQDGGAGGPSPDPISPLTAALYREFRGGGSFGNLPGLGNNLLDTASEIRSLQRALWFEEQELTGSEYTNDTLAVALWNWASANHDGTIRNVRVLNVWGNSQHTSHAQDMLTLIPLPPAGWAGLASLGGVFGLGLLRRRSHNA